MSCLVDIQIILFQIWDTNSGAQLYKTIDLHLEMIRDIQWSQDNLQLVVTGEKITW